MTAVAFEALLSAAAANETYRTVSMACWRMRDEPGATSAALIMPPASWQFAPGASVSFALCTDRGIAAVSHTVTTEDAATDDTHAAVVEVTHPISTYHLLATLCLKLVSVPTMLAAQRAASLEHAHTAVQQLSRIHAFVDATSLPITRFIAAVAAAGRGSGIAVSGAPASAALLASVDETERAEEARGTARSLIELQKAARVNVDTVVAALVSLLNSGSGSARTTSAVAPTSHDDVAARIADLYHSSATKQLADAMAPLTAVYGAVDAYLRIARRLDE
ncbi:hypothetical protein EON66_02915, partial [archaeon]